MPSLDNINARLIERIENSGLTLAVVYPPALVPATGVSPGTAPISPLTGPAVTPEVFEPEPDGYQDEIELQCLWFDSATTSEAGDHARTEVRKAHRVGWVAEATALARVLVSEAALDTDNPYAGTVLDAASHIVFRATRYRIVQVIPVGASFGPPVSYHVWVEGDRK